MPGIAGHLPLLWAYGLGHGSGWSMLDTKAAALLEQYHISSDLCGFGQSPIHVANKCRR
jgi:hypothetical protein